MRLRFRALPGTSDITPRPLVSVFLEGLEDTGLDCLVDTGSLHNRFAAWTAREAGINLAGTETMSIGVGGRSTIARTVPVSLRIGEYVWEAPVSFCDPWPWSFNLLGQEGFFRWFRVVIEAADRTLEIEPQP